MEEYHFKKQTKEVEREELWQEILKKNDAQRNEVIAPSLSTMPTRSMIVIPIRFGFTNKTHVTWRNQPKTKEALEHNNFTASFSNS